MTDGSRAPEDTIDDLFAALSSALTIVRADQASVTTLLEQRLVLFLALANGASHARDRARKAGLPIDAYNDGMVNHHLAEQVSGAFDESTDALSDREVRLACELAEVLVWLAADSLRNDLEGDWLKRFSTALNTLADLDIEVEDRIDEAMRASAVTWPEWMLGGSAGD